MSLRYEVRMKVATEPRPRVVARVEDVSVAAAVASGYRDAAQRQIAALGYLFPWQLAQVEVEVSVYDCETKSVL